MDIVAVGDKFVRMVDGHEIVATRIVVKWGSLSLCARTMIKLVDLVTGVVTWIDGQVFAQGLFDHSDPKYRRQR